MDKILNKKIRLNKSDKIKLSIMIGFITGLISIVSYNLITLGTI
jgi:hypothetical protein